MATTDKDFKVKHGLIVNGSANIAGVVTHANPTNPEHSATKQYVDGRPITIVDWEVPSQPIDGTIWMSLDSSEMLVYYGGAWFSMGLFNTTVEAGSPDSLALSTVSSGSPDTTEFSNLLDGGSF